jgi:hypothetical protein
MIKVAEKFFNEHYFALEHMSDFELTDLKLLLDRSFGGAVFDDEIGIIKIMRCKDTNMLFFFEHLFYDYTLTNDIYPLPLTFVGYISTRAISKTVTRPVKIRNTFAGLSLSKYGFTSFDFGSMSDVTSLYPEIIYDDVQGYDPHEPYATKKYSEFIYDNKALDKRGEYIFRKLQNFSLNSLKFSTVLSYLDAFDANFLQWKKGLSMKPHNDYDYKSFVNLVSYNTEHTNKERKIIVGDFYWYDMYFNNEDLCDIPDNKIKTQLSAEATTQRAVMLNTFNPKFYHEAQTFDGDGEMYTCAANLSFKEMNLSNIKW